MPPITIQRTLSLDGEGTVVLADDAERRAFVGACRSGADGDLVFVQIDRVTMLELERGTIDVSTVIAERCAGLTFEGRAIAGQQVRLKTHPNGESMS